MPGTRHTRLNAFRQLAAIEKHDTPEHFAVALGGARHLHKATATAAVLTLSDHPMTKASTRATAPTALWSPF